VSVAARLFARAAQPPRWPMYIRQVRQYLRAVDESFDERKLGFPGIVEFLRACQREGLLRLERDRQGVLRVFPGPQLARSAAAPAPPSPAPEALEESAAASEPSDLDSQPEGIVDTTAIALGDAAVVVDGEVAAVVDDETEQPAKPARKRTRAGARTAKKAAAPRARKKARSS
jgi:hypothetical protein